MMRDTTCMLTRLRQAAPLGLRKTFKVKRAQLTLRLGIHRFSFPGLAGLDKNVIPYLPKMGTFLEVGANDGYSQSNTYHLERVRGWSGILIEPLPSLFARCQLVRPHSWCYNAACVPDGFASSMIEMADLDLMSVALGLQPEEDQAARLSVATSGNVLVPARTISSIIDDSPFSRIDFMSVDVEGAELGLLDGLDWKRHAPSWLLIETKHLADVIEKCSPWMSLKAQLSYHDYLFERIPASR